MDSLVNKVMRFLAAAEGMSAVGYAMLSFLIILIFLSVIVFLGTSPAI